MRPHGHEDVPARIGRDRRPDKAADSSSGWCARTTLLMISPVSLRKTMTGGRAGHGAKQRGQRARDTAAGTPKTRPDGIALHEKEAERTWKCQSYLRAAAPRIPEFFSATRSTQTGFISLNHLGSAARSPRCDVRRRSGRRPRIEIWPSRAVDDSLAQLLEGQRWRDPGSARKPARPPRRYRRAPVGSWISSSGYARN